MNEYRKVTDEDGHEYVVDEDGKRYIPEQTTRIVGETSGWTLYDTSQGHCELCGSLSCRGRCFK